MSNRRPAGKPANRNPQDVSDLEDRIATLLHEKITTNQKNGDTIISDNTSVKLNMQKMFGIAGSLIIGVAVATTYWTNNQNGYDNTLKTHETRITSVENTIKDMQDMKTNVAKMQLQLELMSKSMTEQKTILDQQAIDMQYIIRSMKVSPKQ